MKINELRKQRKIAKLDRKKESKKLLKEYKISQKQNNLEKKEREELLKKDIKLFTDWLYDKITNTDISEKAWEKCRNKILNGSQGCLEYDIKLEDDIKNLDKFVNENVDEISVDFVPLGTLVTWTYNNGYGKFNMSEKLYRNHPQKTLRTLARFFHKFRKIKDIRYLSIKCPYKYSNYPVLEVKVSFN